MWERTDEPAANEESAQTAAREGTAETHSGSVVHTLLLSGREGGAARWLRVCGVQSSELAIPGGERAPSRDSQDMKFAMALRVVLIHF